MISSAELTITLLIPLVASMRDVPSIVATLPAGATVEYLPVAHKSSVDMAHLVCNGKQYVVFLQDLLSACRIDEVGQIGWP